MPEVKIDVKDNTVVIDSTILPKPDMISLIPIGKTSDFVNHYAYDEDIEDDVDVMSLTPKQRLKAWYVQQDCLELDDHVPTKGDLKKKGQKILTLHYIVDSTASLDGLSKWVANLPKPVTQAVDPSVESRFGLIGEEVEAPPIQGVEPKVKPIVVTLSKKKKATKKKAKKSKKKTVKKKIAKTQWCSYCGSNHFRNMGAYSNCI